MTEQELWEWAEKRIADGPGHDLYDLARAVKAALDKLEDLRKKMDYLAWELTIDLNDLFEGMESD